METLGASLRLITPYLDSALVDQRAAHRLARIADRLAPIHCAGFEVRLGASPRVDLIQRVTALDGEPRRLRTHIRRATPSSGSTAWERVEAFCAAWEVPTSRAWRQVAGAFLEFDSGSDAQPVPSLYLSLEPGASRRASRLAQLLRYAWSLLNGDEPPAELVEGVTRCAGSLPRGADVTDLGFMLAREVEAVRLVIAPLQRDQLSPLLQSVAGPGPRPDLDGALELVPARIDHLALSLDIGAHPLPRVGVEYYPGPFAADVPAWEAALEDLVDAGLCTPGKRAALLRWPGYLEASDARGEWPASLLVASLLNRTDQFIVLSRRLTYLKLVCTPGEPLEAKAYFGYGPRSLAAAASSGEPQAGSAPADGRGAAITLATAPGTVGGIEQPTTEHFHRALTAGAAHLLQQRGDDGMWREFPRILEGTDEWVTAYIGAVLAGLPAAECGAAAQRAWDALLQRRSPAEGWGYNADLPPDADSTLWGVELAAALGRGAAARDAAPFLDAHVHADGGVSTYTSAAEPGLRRLLGTLPLDGMLVPHVCVTAAVAHRDHLAPRTIPFLVDRQEDDGRWRGYWWCDDEYTTALAVTALQRRSGEGLDAVVERARTWAARRLTANGAVWSRHLGAASPFATALCTEILARADSWQAQRRAALRWLLSAQRADGSWSASALMRMPPTNAVDGDDDPRATTVSVDDRALFTTATVLRTLARAADDRR